MSLYSPCHHHSSCGGLSPVSLDELLDRCRAGGLRKTYLLKTILGKMLEWDQPVNVQYLMNLEGISGVCNPATCYRLLARLEETGIIRRIGTHARSIHYILNIPGQHHDYLICSGCGKVEVVTQACPVLDMEKEIAGATGYRELYHELHFFGTCPACV